MDKRPAPLRVLLVEDDEDDYLFTQEFLETITSQTYELTWVNNYRDGLHAVTGQSFDVALIDYRIDTGTGLEFIRMAGARNVDCPMILVTGVRSHEVDIAAQQAGASDYLIKGSLNPEILERSIRYAIEHRERRRVLDVVLANVGAGVIALDSNDGVVMMNAIARDLVSLGEVGELAPDNSIGIYSNVKRFLGDRPYPSRMRTEDGRVLGIEATELPGGSRVVLLSDLTNSLAQAVPSAPGALAETQQDDEPAGLPPLVERQIFLWIDKLIAQTKVLTKRTGPAHWQQFAAETRHSGKRLIKSINAYMKEGEQAPGHRPLRAQHSTPVQDPAPGLGAPHPSNGPGQSENQEPSSRTPVLAR